MTESRETNYAGVFDNRLGWGRKPAVLVIDFTYGYTTPGSPLYAEGVVKAVEASVDLLDAARAAGVPIIYTKVMYHPSGMDGGLFAQKVPVLQRLVPGERLVEIDDRVAPHPEDLVIVKNYPSAFFGTSLAATLTSEGIDTLILLGCSTSGCVRATAIDTIQHGFRGIVPRECVGDRHDGPHDANLFDMNAKYADVLPREEVIAHLKGLARTKAA
ncbi:N-carbamoylsarcosine amidohydrolase [Futiania mangrovi]|uniref:N-carbamoylsarcosine amidohydrolase n=1 Tax=Futiania mangrovi TaxID=2959716 RepID=A0A9J6P9V6_9PROT|nr:N-carbamoylsarcosine amidohydrolase [Futiania mangrovii]MCP1335741.1 N-carbamoylsarcosine amidohydrolase [Futiania mangrovii]